MEVFDMATNKKKPVFKIKTKNEKSTKKNHNEVYSFFVGV
jgi:hypothetical protein